MKSYPTDPPFFSGSFAYCGVRMSNALVDRGRAIGQSVQEALDLLSRAKIIDSLGDSLYTKYKIVSENYLSASYMAGIQRIYKFINYKKL